MKRGFLDPTKAKPAYFGSAQEQYKVQSGDIWQIGPHQLICSDFVTMFRSNQLGSIPKIDVVHTDPPWTSSIYEQFYKWSGTRATFKFPLFIEYLFDAIHMICPDGLVIIEIGHNLAQTIERTAKEHEAQTLHVQPCTYSSKRVPYYHWVGTFGTASMPKNLYALGTHDMEVVTSIANATARPGVTFADPMCGEGLFLDPAIGKGATIYGIELIPRKFAEGLRRLSKHGIPHKIGSL